MSHPTTVEFVLRLSWGFDNIVFSTSYGKDRCSPTPFTSARGVDCFTDCQKEYYHHNHYKCHIDEDHTILEDCGFWNSPSSGIEQYTIENKVTKFLTKRNLSNRLHNKLSLEFHTQGFKLS